MTFSGRSAAVNSQRPDGTRRQSLLKRSAPRNTPKIMGAPGRGRFFSGWYIVMLGAMLGPLIVGILYDRYGSYELAFTIIAIIAAFGSIFFMLSWRPKPPALRQSPATPLPNTH